MKVKNTDKFIKNTNKKFVVIDAELGVSLSPGQVMLVIAELAEKALKVKGVVETKKKKSPKKKK